MPTHTTAAECSEAIDQLTDLMDRALDEAGGVAGDIAKISVLNATDTEGKGKELAELAAKRNEWLDEYDNHWRPIVDAARDKEKRDLEAALARQNGVGVAPQTLERISDALEVPVWRGAELHAKLNEQRAEFAKMNNVSVDFNARALELNWTGGEAAYMATVDSGDTPARFPFRPGITPIPQEPTSVLDVLPAAMVPGQDVFEWIRESTHTAGAASRAEGAAAPESTQVWAIVTNQMEDITDSIPFTERSMMKAGWLVPAVSDVLIGNIRRKFEELVLFGDGTSPNIRGITNTTGIQTQARGTDSNIDALRKLLTKMRNAAKGQYRPDWFAVNPSNLETIALLKETTTAGAYIMGPPGSTAERRLWTLRYIESAAVTANTGVVLTADPAAGEVGIGANINVQFSDSHASNFTSWITMARAKITGVVGVREVNSFGTLTAMN